MTQAKRPTIADLRALKGQRQLSMLRVETLDEAAAAQQAGIDMLSVPPALLGPAFREAAPSCFAVPGLEYGDSVTAEANFCAAFKAMRAGGDLATLPPPWAHKPTRRRARHGGQREVE